jgi:four helix bundle protein
VAESIIQRKSFAFAVTIVQLCRRLEAQKEYVISRQLLRSGTSVGANVEEATAAQSRPDFLTKMTIASKEARETRYWLRVLEQTELRPVDVTRELHDVDEVIRILTAICKSTTERPHQT